MPLTLAKETMEMHWKEQMGEQNGQILLQKSVDEIREENGKSVDALFREVFRW